jgi:N-acetylglucosamine-6-sulfatase
VNRVLDALADTGRLANTLIVFGSDNGYSWGEHRWRYKVAPYEEDIRVPLVIRWDPYTAVPRTEQHLALNIDVAPTLAAAAGVQATGVDGRSLLPIVDGTTSNWRAKFLIESYEFQPRDGPKVPSYCAVRTRYRKFVHYATGEEEFYTLNTDPFELRNKVSLPSSRKTVDTLRVRARALCNPLPPGMPGF